jgi:hypothetical protein
MILTLFTSFRSNRPDLLSLQTTIRTITSDATALISITPDPHQWMIGTAIIMSAGTISAVQTAIDIAIDATPPLDAQNSIDHWPIELKALVLALIDQLNVIRAALVPPKVAITSAQALQAVRDKAATL